jgi:hypothetical protein
LFFLSHLYPLILQHPSFLLRRKRKDLSSIYK